MSTNQRQMHLNLFLLNLGHHEAAWRSPEVQPKNVIDFDYYKRLALKAEEGKLDSIFLADRAAVSREMVKYAAFAGLEPITLLSGLAVATKQIGLIATVSTSFNEPFNVARKFASLDQISGGRVGWNIVTSGTDAEAQNYSLEQIYKHTERYERAQEFVDVVTQLWDSWEEGALVQDQAKGIYADPDKVHEVGHQGEWFSVRGPLNVPRSPQGQPVLIQAGSSEDGKEFAAQYAEAIFTAQRTLPEAQSFYKDVKTRMLKYGRSPEGLKILPGISVIIGATEEEAKEKEARLQELTIAEYGLSQLSARVNLDLSAYPLDGPLPELPDVEDIQGHQSRFKLITDLARKDNLTIRQLLLRLAGGRGHRTLAGTAVQVADQLEEWFLQGGADGFNVMPPYLPGGLDDFVDYVVPELQRRGLFRTEYAGSTLREHYGLSQPVNRFSKQGAH